MPYFGWECEGCRYFHLTEEAAEACEESHRWVPCGRRFCPTVHKTEADAAACQFIPAPMTYKQFICSLYPMSTAAFVTEDLTPL